MEECLLPADLCKDEQLEKSMIFQGLPYRYAENQTIVRLAVTLIDAVDYVVLQSALDQIMSTTDYFCVSFDYKTENASAVKNQSHCLVYTGHEMREIPSETNGYLFYLSYENNTIFFTWDHFLTDGRGAIRFMNELLKAYCGQKYNACFMSKELRSSPFIDAEQLFTDYRRKRGSKRQSAAPETNGNLHASCRIRAEKSDLIRYAEKHSVKPFSAMMFLIGQAVCNPKDGQISSYTFPVDARIEMGVNNALYNCTTNFIQEIDMCQSSATILCEIDAAIKGTLVPENVVSRMVEFQKVFYDLFRMKVSDEIKERAFNLAQRTTATDYMFSYLGNPLTEYEKGLEQYIQDYYLRIVSGDGIIPLVVEEVTYKNQMSLCCTGLENVQYLSEQIVEKLKKAGISAQLESCF